MGQDCPHVPDPSRAVDNTASRRAKPTHDWRIGSAEETTMAKTRVPKKLMGFKLRKGTRKDLKKLLKMVAHPDTRTLAVSAAGALAAFIAERFAEYEIDKRSKGGRQAQAH
jgi:hypothetical protein